MQPGRDDCFAVMRSSSEEGSYLRLVDFGITQLQAESNKEEEDRDEAAPVEWKGGCRRRANSAQIRQSRPDSGRDLSHFSGERLNFFLSCSLLARRALREAAAEREVDNLKGALGGGVCSQFGHLVEGSARAHQPIAGWWALTEEQIQTLRRA